MNQICRKCKQEKEIEKFKVGRTICKTCYNAECNAKYPLSECGYCKLKHKPTHRSLYLFCSEICRFMDKVIKDDSTGCWNWQASLSKKGYGQFSPLNVNDEHAHRASYRIFKGEFDKEKHVLHTCHNRSCVNPSHLKLGDNSENVKDRVLANRSNTPKGIDHFKCKLTNESVLEIRKKYLEGISMTSLAKMYGVSRGNVGYIINRKNWKHI